MMPFAGVMLDVLVDEASEMALTERHHAMETLILDRPDEPLRIRVEIRTPAWETDWVDTAASENLLEDPRVQRITVVNQMV